MSKVRNFNEWDMEERVNDLEQHTYGPLARRTDIAPDFSAEAAYAKDDVVYYNGVLYKFTTDHAAGAWNSAEVEVTTIAENLGYELPIASASTLGGVKVGNGLSIDAETGVLSAAGGAASVEKVLAGALETRLNGIIQAYGDGTKVICDYIEYPMYVSREESGEEYNTGTATFRLNSYVRRVDSDTQKTYGRATVMTVDGNVGKSKHYTIRTDAADTTQGVMVRFTNVEIDIQKQADDSYNCIISYDKAYLVPKTRTQVEITTVEYDMTNAVPLDPYASPTITVYEVTSISSTPDNARYAKMIDITPAVEYQAEYRTFNGKFKSLITVSADLQTFNWVMNNSAYISFPKQAKEANGLFLQVVEELSKYPYAGDGYVLSCASISLSNEPANYYGVQANLDGFYYFRYVNMSDGIVLVPDEV